MKAKLIHFYNNCNIGMQGEIIKSWIDKDNIRWYEIYFGKNLSGQKLRGRFPEDVIKII